MTSTFTFNLAPLMLLLSLGEPKFTLKLVMPAPPLVGRFEIPIQYPPE